MDSLRPLPPIDKARWVGVIPSTWLGERFAIYAGVPVANTAFAQARKLIEEARRKEHQM